MSIPTAYATLSNCLPSKPYVLSITPAPSSSHLILRHPSSDLTIVDNQTLQAVDRLAGGHDGNIMDVKVDGAVWSGGKDAAVVRWDERSRRPATKLKAFIRKPLPVLSIASSERDHLVMAGTELLSSEAHIIFWDTRSTKEPVYTHSSTHSDDITHLSLLPSTSTYLPRSADRPLPDQLLLSASTDGLVALSDMKESDEDEAVQSAENFGQSIAQAGWYEHKGKMKVWGRSDMDAVGIWNIGKGEEDDIEMQDVIIHDTERFRSREFSLPKTGPSTTQTAQEERDGKNAKLKSDYLINVVPSLGISSEGLPMTAVGTNEGNIVLMHGSTETYNPSAYFLTHPNPSTGHKDVVRALYHDLANQAIYTGSEDGVISGWSLASLPERLRVGDKDLDDVEDDNGEDSDERTEESEIETEESDDGMDVDDDNGEDSDERTEESEIETEESDDGMDVDDEDKPEAGPRYGPIIGGGSGADRRERNKGRTKPY